MSSRRKRGLTKTRLLRGVAPGDIANTYLLETFLRLMDRVKFGELTDKQARAEYYREKYTNDKS